MRVCVITVAGYMHGIGGMQDHTSNLVGGLVEAGHDVEVITTRHPEGLRQARHHGATWHFVDAPAWSERLPKRHPEWLRRSTVQFVELHERHAVDVVHSESTSALGLLSAGVHRKVPVVAKFHGNYVTFAREILRRTRMTGDVGRGAKDFVWTTGRHFLTPGNVRLFRACEAMVASQAQLADTRWSHLLKRSRVHVVPNGIDTELFSPGSRSEARAALGLGAGTVFVSVGRIYRGKGVSNAIDALALLPETRLLVVGDGEEREALERHAREIGLDGRVTFTGAVPPEQVAPYLQAADGFVFPTLLPEAAPLILLQAMSCGLPVVASRVGAIPEIVGAPSNALLVPPGDVAALSDGMRAVAGDAALRQTMGEAARARALAEFTIPRMIERTVAVYELAIGAHGASRSGRTAPLTPS